MKFQDKVVIVTGSSSGIGAATAIEYVKNGAKVTINGRNVEKLAKTKQKCYEAGAKEENVLTVVADLKKEEERNKLVDETIKHFGHVDILVNNAGTVCTRSVIESTMEELEEMLNIHVKAPYALSKRALPSIIEHKGAIINVSSGGGIRPDPLFATYSMAKTALDRLTQVLALEVADKGVRVNSINPGYTYSDILGDLDKKGSDGRTPREKFDDQARIMHPNKKVTEPEEVARSILFLSSEEVGTITGVLLPIDGGKSLAAPGQNRN